MTIRTIKTWYGRKHCIVDESGSIVELKTSDGSFARMAVYPYNKIGLQQAREKLAQLKG